jgi:PEP-CTERM motif
VTDPTGLRVRVRRRATRRHRRNRVYRRVLLAATFVLGGLAGAAFLPFDFSSYLTASFSNHPAPQWKSADVHRDLALSAAPDSSSSDQPSANVHPVYPYSLVPGGVHDPKELEQAFEHDPVLAAHYRGFDFRRARVVQLTEDKTVYVSYRIAGRVYWTTKKVRLRRGEKVITDGKMTLRTRCGNQVSDTARQEVSPQEPSIAKMEEPIKIDGGTVAPYPTNFDSALTRPNVPSFGPTLPRYGLIANNGGLLSLYPPPLPTCEPGKTKKGSTGGGVTAPGSSSSGGKKKGGGGCGEPPAEVPEPGTLVLFATGLAGMLLRYRKSLSLG